MYLLLLSSSEDDDKGSHKDNKTEAAPSSSVHSHPVVGILKRLERTLSATRFADVEQQLDVLVKAASMMEDVVAEEQTTATEEELSISEPQVSENEESAFEEMDDDVVVNNREEEEEEDATMTVDDAKFALRPREVMEATKKSSKTGISSRKRTDDSGLADFGDSATAETTGFASTLNSIEQRGSHSKQKKQIKPEATNDDDYDHADTERGYADVMDEDDDNMRMMTDNDDGKSKSISKSRRKHESSSKSSDDPSSFYGAIEDLARQKKAAKGDMYKVAPKYPGLEHEVSGKFVCVCVCFDTHNNERKKDRTMEINVLTRVCLVRVGERALSRAILKNRGLVAHKAKINRNPRVKKRMQYRKALIRRKGTVRGIRVDEAHKYAGEGTGIKSKISRSRKL
jgi:U3 small nucleolar RNA-associated protein 3